MYVYVCPYALTFIHLDVSDSHHKSFTYMSEAWRQVNPIHTLYTCLQQPSFRSKHRIQLGLNEASFTHRGAFTVCMRQCSDFGGVLSHQQAPPEACAQDQCHSLGAGYCFTDGGF